MVYRKYTFLPILLVLAQLAFAAGPPSPQQAKTGPIGSFDPKPVAVLPFELAGGAIWLPVAVNGSPAQHFLFDTGAGSTVINRSRAAAMGLRLDGDHLQENAGAGENSTLIGLVPDVVFTLSPEVGVRLERSAVIALDEIARSYGSAMDGIIGGDLMDRYVVAIDYDSRKLSLFDPAGFRYSGTGLTLPIKVINKISYVQGTVAVSGRPPVSGMFMIDSPIRDAVVFSAPFTRRHRLKSGVPKMVPHRAIGVGGWSAHSKGRIRSLRIGPFTFARPVAHFPEDRAGAFAREDMAGAFGAELLRRFRVILDYSRSRVILEPNAHLREPWPADASGLLLRCPAGDYRSYEVMLVVPGSPAEQAGVQVGDRITAVDNVPASELALWQIRQILRQPGRNVMLGIAGPSAERRVILSLRELLE
jgi:hypothetical protein